MPIKAFFSLLLLLLLSCSNIKQPPQTTPNSGKQIAFSREKGNCLACHEIEDGEFPGNIGPALKNVANRYKTKQQLRAQIWDASQFNPETSMPPFGKNKILSEQEIDLVADYLWVL